MSAANPRLVPANDTSPTVLELKDDVIDLPPPSEAKTARRRRLRGPLFGALFALVALAGLLWAGWWYFAKPATVSTDDAYVDAQVASITPEVAGTIRAVLVRDTTRVKRGDVLVERDPADARIAVDQATAAYEQALRRVHGYFANTAAAEAAVTARIADLQRAQLDYDRRQRLFAETAISDEQLSTARNALDDARANLATARQQLAAQRAMISGASAPDNPEVLAAKAALDRAKLDLSRTTIRAPIDGIVSQRTAQIGQRVAVGDALMMVVPLDEMHVNANFKESQLEEVHAGQRAMLTSDLYGSNVVFHGTVEGLGGGTGAAFAVIPAQNATGNWIKVVQRLPVRIALDPRELQAHPLRVGLSMSATVELDRHR